MLDVGLTLTQSDFFLLVGLFARGAVSSVRQVHNSVICLENICSIEQFDLHPILLILCSFECDDHDGNISHAHSNRLPKVSDSNCNGRAHIQQLEIEHLF